MKQGLFLKQTATDNLCSACVEQQVLSCRLSIYLQKCILYIDTCAELPVPASRKKPEAIAGQSKTYVLCLDLKDDKDKIAQYIEYHKEENFWPSIGCSIKQSGIESMDIFQTGNRLVMIITADSTFSFEAKARLDASNPEVQQWEKLMEAYQQRLPWTAANEKWQLMDQIFSLP